MRFRILATDGKARAGVIKTARGEIHTPAVTVNFTPALLRSGLKPAQVKALGAEVVLVNTVHTHLANVGNVHKFLNWDGPVMADSGGFQMISLADKLSIRPNGIDFEIDGKKLEFTPQKVLDIQKSMGVDLMMPLDFVVSVRQKNLWQFVKAAIRTAKWFAPVGRQGYKNLYYIVQGGTSSLARWLSLRDANRWLKRGVKLVALGGISLGESKREIYNTVKFCCDWLPADVPRHLLGVGDPADLLECIARGIDTFDCVLTTRSARHGQAWTSGGYLHLEQARYTDDQKILDDKCDCPTCQSRISRAELRAGLKSEDKEIVKKTKIKLMLHNIRFVMKLMEQSRAAITKNEFQEFKQQSLSACQATRSEYIQSSPIHHL